MERVGVEVDRLELSVRDADLGRVAVSVEAGVDLEAAAGGGRTDEVDDGFERDEWFAAPVDRDEREEAVLDLVPLAGARRQVNRR